MHFWGKGLPPGTENRTCWLCEGMAGLLSLVPTLSAVLSSGAGSCGPLPGLLGFQVDYISS